MVSVSKLVTALAKRFGGGMLHYDDLMAAIADVPSTDAVEPVRCGKCQHWEEDEESRGEYGECYCHGNKRRIRKPADGYCDRGRAR